MLNQKHERSISAFIIWMALFFLVLVTRLYYLQILRGDEFYKRSESNFIQEKIVKHSRGKIYDRNGQLLADNRLSYDVYVTFALLPDSLKSLISLLEPLEISRPEIKEVDQELLARVKNDYYQMLEVKRDLNVADCARIQEISRIKMIDGVHVEDYVLGSNETKCRVLLSVKDFPSQTSSFNLLKKLLRDKGENLSDHWLKAQKRARGLGRFQPQILQADVGFDAYARIENLISLGKLAGVSVATSKRRRYLHGDLATHSIGFMNQVSLEELKDSNNDYKSGDYVGRRGVEASFEEWLRGNDGIERVVVDAKGRRFSPSWEEGLLGETREVASRPGASLKMTIDRNIQAFVQKFFSGVSGSVVVLDVNTGFILALASFPSFDPNEIVSADNRDTFLRLVKDQHRPLRNKAVQDHYSPGSIFKPISAIAGLEKHVINPSYEHNCRGSYKIHRTTWRCFRRWGHGPIDLLEALKVSCDSYFYELGHRLGLENLSEISSRFGFGKKTQIDLLGEAAGIVPSKTYYNERFGYVAPGFVVNMSIGQGDLTVTPMQLAVAYAAIANGGKIFRPQLVSEIMDSAGNVKKSFSPELIDSFTETNFSFKDIVKSLSYVTQSGGSAFSLRYRPEFVDISQWLKEKNISIAGKTGTAQVVKLSKQVDHVKPEDVEYRFRDHAWFVGIYPSVAPEIVIVVMTEHGGYGGLASAPVAVRIMREWENSGRSNVKNMRVKND